MDVLGYIVADHRRGLRVVLRNLLGDLDEFDQVVRFGGLVLKGIGVEDGDAGGAWVELDRVAAIFHFGISVVIVQIKLLRDGAQRSLDDLLRDADDERLFIDLCACLSEELTRLRILDFDARFEHQLIRLFDDAREDFF